MDIRNSSLTIVVFLFFFFFFIVSEQPLIIFEKNYRLRAKQANFVFHVPCSDLSGRQGFVFVESSFTEFE